MALVVGLANIEKKCIGKYRCGNSKLFYYLGAMLINLNYLCRRLKNSKTSN